MTRFLRRLKRSAWLILGIAFATTFFSVIGALDPWRNAWFDVFSLMTPAPDSGDVQVVGIDEQDFRAPPFNEALPIAPDALVEVVSAIARGRPRAIGIDIQTSRPEFKDLWQRIRPALRDIPTVWVSSASISEACYQFPGSAPCLYTAAAPLAGRAPLNTGRCSQVCAASEILLTDADNVVRRYSRFVASGTSASERTFMPSLAWAAIGACGTREPRCAHVFAQEPDGDERGLDPRLIRFNQLARHKRWNAYGVEELLHDADSAVKTGSEGFEPLRDKIVLLGGAFPESRDLHSTTVGDRYGVDIWAQVIEDELHGGLRDVNEVRSLAIDIVCGIALVAIGAAFSFRRALWLSLGAIPVLSLAASWLAFSSFTL